MIRSIVLWCAFVVLFIGSVWALEMLEGSKITTTEYYGLRNLGGSFLYYFFLIGAFCYPIVLMPITFILNRWIRCASIRTALYIGLGTLLGWRLFHMLYNHFAGSYDLRMGSALTIFGLLGLLYGILDMLTAREDARFKQA